jgi:hypothetical protein
MQAAEIGAPQHLAAQAAGGRMATLPENAIHPLARAEWRARLAQENRRANQWR